MTNNELSENLDGITKNRLLTLSNDIGSGRYKPKPVRLVGNNQDRRKEPYEFHPPLTK